MPMNKTAGRFDTPCEFRQYTFTQDDLGSPIYTWDVVTGAPIWCRVEPLKGLERIEAGKLTATHICKIVIRRFEDIHPSMEVWFRGEMWNIKSIEDFGRTGIMILYVELKQ